MAMRLKHRLCWGRVSKAQKPVKAINVLTIMQKVEVVEAALVTRRERAHRRGAVGHTDTLHVHILFLLLRLCFLNESQWFGNKPDAGSIFMQHSNCFMRHEILTIPYHAIIHHQ